ncbi:hypothetical protein [Maritimibacter sp. DP1N21-5]|uniref:hypothetical protein n=1 Tax=Maritimibacter sp. DP1N21-5 TaxID=2836867 RepID=UPI001C437759|nr:hypothetical protein [Maritimibacter sp. DP1N21-5]MBV7409064.1 hypothetical protein [Maritimibacter sp. DP1N21-5]
MTIVLILCLGLMLGTVAWGTGRAGAPWAVLAGIAAVPVVGVAVWFSVTNTQVPVGEGFDEPGFSGALVGAVLALLCAPMWVGGYVMGRKGRKGSL